MLAKACLPTGAGSCAWNESGRECVTRTGRTLKPLDIAGAQENVRIIDEINGERRKGVRDAIRVALKRKQLEGSVKSLEARHYEAKKLLRRVEELERRLPKGFDPNSE
jgi:hypothetical protein